VTQSDVRAFGAVGDGRTLDTRAIQAAIDARAASGGGTVRVPPGAFVTGALALRDDITLELDAGARLLGSLDPSDYPPVHARWEGVHRETHSPLIGGTGLRNVAVVGRGTIDGRGAPWWERHRARTLTLPRPRLIAFSSSRDVLIRDVTLLNSPSWTVNPVRCENVTVQNVTIVNPHDSPNTDGINPDSCRYVRIADCYIDVGDDCITIKSGIETEATELRGPCENIAVTNCTMVHGHGGVVIGSEMSGDVRNVVISNCVFTGTERGIRIKTRRGRGGVVEDVLATNIVMREVGCPFVVNLYYNFLKKGDPVVADRGPRPVDDGTPHVRRIRFSQIQAHDARFAAAFLWGLPERPVEDVVFRDVGITVAAEALPGEPDMLDGLAPMARAGFIARHVRGLRRDGLDVRGQAGDAFVMEDVL
jgi:polygalacturonase